MINLTVFMWPQLKWLQSYKNINWDLVILVMKLYFVILVIVKETGAESWNIKLQKF